MSKPKKTAYLVCDGAMCLCDSGAKPAKLKVTKNKKIYINDDSRKLLATEMDWTFDPPSLPFGTCKNKPGQDKSCTPAFTKWDKAYESITAEGYKAITDKSELRCSAFQGKITILKHGQTQQVSPGQIANANQAIASLINPLAVKPLPRKEEEFNVSVTGIEAEVEAVESPPLNSQKHGPVKSYTTQEVKNIRGENPKVRTIFARPGENILFTASVNKKGNASLVSWKISGLDTGENIYFLQEGHKFERRFHEEGTYRVEAYGTGGDGLLDADKRSNADVDRTEYDDCSLLIKIQANKLAGIRIKGDPNNVILGSGDLPDQVRAGFPVTIEASFTMPPLQEDVDQLVIFLRDESGSELKQESKTAILTFTPENTAAFYIAEAYMNGTGGPSTATCIFETIANAVKVIGSSIGRGAVVRPGTEITFKVERLTFKDQVQDFEKKQVKWFLEGNEEVRGFGLEHKEKITREGKYCIRAMVNSSDRIIAFFEGKGQTDDWKFTVTRNYPTGIRASGKAKLGKTVSFTADTIMPVTAGERKEITWSIGGPVAEELAGSDKINVPFRKTGLYKVRATLNGKSTEITVVCNECMILDGWWTDRDGNYLAESSLDGVPTNTLGFAGWGQQVCASFKHLGLEGEKVIIKLYDSDQISGNDELDSKEVTLPDKQIVGYTFDLNKDIREKATNMFSSTARLYFTVEQADPKLKVINKGMALPKDSGRFLQVDTRQRCIAYFADANDERRYHAVSQKTSVHIQIKTTGYQDDELEAEVWEKTGEGEGKMLQEKGGNRKPDKTGMLSVPISMSKIPLKNASDSKQLYIKVFTKKDKKQIYSSDNIAILTVYKELLSDKADKTSKALVVVDVSEGATGSCGGLYCIKTGDVSELVREINIRLAGFGGLVPTDQFTAETRKGVIQFQQDYMKIEPTGKVCGNTLKAIDEFSIKFAEKIENYTCLCKNLSVVEDKCGGFGKGRYNGEYTSNTKKEAFYKYEYPGIHRSLLWGVSALKFYLSIQSEYKYAGITAGYRCWDHNNNIIPKRTSTNHMGKAVDIQFDKGSWQIRGKLSKNLPALEDIVSKFYSKLDIKPWGTPNKFNKEPIGLGDDQTYSWIHMDVRGFDRELYLKEEFFINDQSGVIGQTLISKANKLTNSCSGKECAACNTNNKRGVTERVDPKSLVTSAKGKAFIKAWENFEEKAYNDSKGYCTIGYGHLIAYDKCENITLPEEFKDKITEDRAYELFEEALLVTESAVKRDIKVKLYQYEFDAFVSLLYNLGPKYLFLNKAPKLLKNINSEKYQEAAFEFLDITNNGTPGLVKRRKAENNMFLNNIYDSTH